MSAIVSGVPIPSSYPQAYLSLEHSGIRGIFNLYTYYVCNKKLHMIITISFASDGWWVVKDHVKKLLRNFFSWDASSWSIFFILMESTIGPEPCARILINLFICHDIFVRAGSPTTQWYSSTGTLPPILTQALRYPPSWANQLPRLQRLQSKMDRMLAGTQRSLTRTSSSVCHLHNRL